MKRRNQKKQSDSINFLFYTSIVITITVSFIILLTIKNECTTTQFNINQLNKIYSNNSNVVKELQSNKEYLISEKYINKILSNKMFSVAPETLLIKMNAEK